MKNIFKKITIISLILVAFSFAFNCSKADKISNEDDIMPINEEITEVNENQGQIIDTKSINGVYKLSDDKANIYLPFVRYATDRIILDKENISNIGTVFSATTVEVNEKQGGLKCIFANDTVRINNEMDYAIIFAGQNVVIDSKINGSIIIFGGSTVTFTEKSEVVGDVLCFSTDLELKGKVSGSLIGGSSKVNISGSILKDLRVECSNLDIATNENVKGNIYIETYNQNISIKDKYPNALVKVNENKTKLTKTEILKNISKAFIVCLIFTAIFVLVSKKSNIIDDSIKLAKKHVIFLILSGSLSLLLSPFIILILLILSVVNLEFIAIPVLFVYLTFLLVSGLLSTFIVGSLMIKYISDNYLKQESKWMKIGFCFLTFVVLYSLARIPYIGSYVTWGLIILSNGIVLLRIFKNKSLKS